jgi:hypothetical protein
MADDFKSLRGNVEHRAVCLTCRFWGPAGLVSNCRRYPPVFAPDVNKWCPTVTGAYEWCGEHDRAHDTAIFHRERDLRALAEKKELKGASDDGRAERMDASGSTDP